MKQRRRRHASSGRISLERARLLAGTAPTSRAAFRQPAPPAGRACDALRRRQASAVPLLAAGPGSRFGASKLRRRSVRAGRSGRSSRASRCERVERGGRGRATTRCARCSSTRARGRRVRSAPTKAWVRASRAACRPRGRTPSGWLVALADMPWIAPATDRRGRAMRCASGASLAAPVVPRRARTSGGFARAHTCGSCSR